jgi:hypothetical protein
MNNRRFTRLSWPPFSSCSANADRLRMCAGDFKATWSCATGDDTASCEEALVDV